MGPAIFFSPHQDDEVLSMGASLKEHVQAGREVIVVLCTDGSGSTVGPRYPSIAEFVKERDREFTTAVHRMGATPVIPANRGRDSQLTVAEAEALIQPYAMKYPTGSLKTMSPWDNNTDHANLGQALRNLKFPDSRYYIKTEQRNEIDGWYTQTKQNLRQELLDYAPVAWLSVRHSCETIWNDARSKIHA
jgi:LmbE family N-acetylglucosaminyl deacetylase